MAWACPATALAADCKPLRAALVADFSGSPSDYSLVRAGRRIPVAIFKKMQDGDRLQVLTAGETLSVQLADRSLTTVRWASGPQCVRQSGQANWITNGIEQLGNLLTLRRKQIWYGIGRGERKPGEKLQLGLPDLAAGTAQVGAGRRRIAFLWKGGEAPFSIEVADPEGRIIVKEERVYARLLLLREPRNLTPGRYRVSLRDGAGTEAVGGFEAIAGGTSGPVADSSGAALLTAAELVDASPNRLFDAFLLLGPHYKERTTVGWMISWLAERSPAPTGATH